MNRFQVCLLITTALCLLGTTPTLNADIRTRLEAYREALGDADALDDLRSLRLQGTITQGDAEVRFLVYKKEPALLRREVTLPSGKTLVQVSGDTGQWQWVRGMDASVPEPITGTPADFLLAQASMYGPLLGEDGDPARGFDYIDMVTLPHLDRQAHPVRVGRETGCVIDAYLDHFTDRLIELHYRPTADAPPVEMRFGDFRDVEGLTFPHRIEYWFRGELLSVAEISQIDVNFSVYSFFFRRPR